MFCSHHLVSRGDAEARLHHRRHTHVAASLRLIGLHLARVPQIDQWWVSGMDQTVYGAVRRRLQRVVGTVQPVLQRLWTQRGGGRVRGRAEICCLFARHLFSNSGLFSESEVTQCQAVWQNTQSFVSAAKKRGLGMQYSELFTVRRCLTMPAINNAIPWCTGGDFWWIYEFCT